jgi:hypothetical protein
MNILTKNELILVVITIAIFSNFSLKSDSWAELITSAGVSNSGTFGSKIVALPNGDLIVGGQYKADEIIFGDIIIPSVVSAAKLVSLDKKKAFIAKISNKKFIWASIISSKGEDENLILRMKTDSNGNIFVLGTATNPVTIGGTTINKTGKKQYAYLVKLDTNGICLWTKAIDFYNTPEDISFDVNNNGEIVVATTVLQLERKITQDKITYNRPGSYSSAVLIRFSSEGNCIWIKGGVSEGAGSASTSKGVVIDKEGNAYVCGEYMGGDKTTGKLTFNEKHVLFPKKVTVTPACGAIFIAKYDKDGVCQFVSNSGSNLNRINQKPKAFNLVISEDEKTLYVVGRFTKEFTIWDNDGETPLKEVKNTAMSTYFISVFDNNGKFQNLNCGEAKNCWIEIANFKKVGNEFYLMGSFAGNLEPIPNKRFVSTQNRNISRQKLFPFIITLNNNLEFTDCKVIEANAETILNDFCVSENNITILGTFDEAVNEAIFDEMKIETQKGFFKTFIWNK